MTPEMETEMSKPLSAVDRLRLWLVDPDTFDPITPEDAEAILAIIDGEAAR